MTSTNRTTHPLPASDRVGLAPHPYAEAWPMLDDADLQELAADIAANGLRTPIVLHDGLILDGRNRYAACELASVAVETADFDGDDDEALAFVQSVNNMRRHQSKGARAASWAVSQLTANKRSGRRWKYGEGPDSDLSKARRSELGVIADFAPDLLPEVSHDRMTLNAAYEQAKAVKDADDQRLAAEAREAESEAEAQAFIEAEDADLAAQVGGGVVDTYREAVALWESRNAAEVSAQRKRKAEHDAAVRRHADYIRAFLSGVHTAAGMGDHPLRDEVLDALPPHDRERFLRIEKESSWPTTN